MRLARGSPEAEAMCKEKYPACSIHPLKKHLLLYKKAQVPLEKLVFSFYFPQ